MRTYINAVTPPRQTPQTRPMDERQVVNAAGGYAWPVDDWIRLHRFLILGTEGGTHYIGERQLTKENAQAVLRCIKENGLQVVEEVLGVSTNGLAPKNDPALFVLALCCAYGDTATKRHAFDVLPQVARTGTHLFQFVEAASAMRGWGRLMRHGIQNWYQSKSTRDLVYQLVKYRQRGGWSHRDVLRHVRPTPRNDGEAMVYRWATDGTEPAHEKDGERTQRSATILRSWLNGQISGGVVQDLALLGGFETARYLASNSPGSLPGLIREYRLTHEMLPTEVLGRADVWQALLENMPLGAVVRNLGRMTANGALRAGSDEARYVISELINEYRVQRARLHPLNLVEAARIYAQGHGERGGLSWSPIPAITNALNDAIEHSFGALETSGKRVLIGVDTSGSMSAQVNGIKAPMSCKEAAAIMALATVKSHPEATVVGFHTEKFPLDISSRDRFSTAVRTVNNAPSGGTDCALPILYALENGMEVDAFIILSDEETWAGRMHPVQALREYRRLTGIPAKLIAVAMAPKGYSVADPNDAGSLLCVGLDTSVPQVIKAFLSD